MAEKNNEGLIMEMNIFATSVPTNVRIPKVIADIVICGALHIKINEDTAG